MRQTHDVIEESDFDTRSWITLRWTRGTRYFRVHLEQDLWREWVLTQVNGRIDSRLGRARIFPAPTIEAGLLRLADAAKRLRQRGYVLNTERHH
jgi:hypothetical protein